MMCVRLPLTSTSGELRAATLRAVRYLVTGPAAVEALTQVITSNMETADISFCDCLDCPRRYFKSPPPPVESQHTECQVNLHQLLVRALDLDLDNRPERVQALKLARRILIFGRWARAVCICNSNILKIFVFTLKIFVSTLKIFVSKIKIFVFTLKIFVRVDSFPVCLVRCLVAILQRGATQHRARSVECRHVTIRYWTGEKSPNLPE